MDPERRPQEPTPPFPYSSREVELADPDGSGRRSGALTLPYAAGPHPAVLLIPGSGKQDRDEAVCGHRPFLVLADALTRAGFVVLRLDDRGVGGSTGDKDELDHAALAADAADAVRWLASQPEVTPGRAFALGHSEGALHAAALAARGHVAGAVLLAGPAIPGHRLVLAQSELLGRAAGTDEASLAHESAMNAAAFAAIRRGDTNADLRSEVRAGLLAALLAWPGGGLSAAEAESAATAMTDVLCKPAFVALLRSEPAELLAAIRVPVLALYGERDLQVPAALNAGAMRDALGAVMERGPHRRSAVEVVPGVNHLFQRCVSGTIEEYATLDETIAPEVLARIVGWLRES